MIWWRNNLRDLHLLKRENKGYYSTALWNYKCIWFFHWIKFVIRKKLRIVFVSWFFRKHGTTTEIIAKLPNMWVVGMWWSFKRYIWFTLRIFLYSIDIRKDVHATFKDIQNAVEEIIFMKYMVKQNYILMPTNYYNGAEFIYFRKRGCEYISKCCLNPAII